LIIFLTDLLEGNKKARPERAGVGELNWWRWYCPGRLA